MQNILKQQSSRADLPSDKLEPLRVRQPGIKYVPQVNFNEKWLKEEQDRYKDLTKEIFGPILK